MSLAKQYSMVQEGVVKIVAEVQNSLQLIGTGTVIDDGSVILTCAHCIVCNNMGIIHPKNPEQFYPGNILLNDTKNDIALIKLPQVLGVHPIKFANSNAVKIGDDAFVVGYPMGIEEQVLVGAHIATANMEYIRIDASVNHGNSGGPLFNDSGEQIGVVNLKHGSLSRFLQEIKAAPTPGIFVNGVNAVETIQRLITEMQNNLNLGIGYAVPTQKIKTLHEILTRVIP